MKITLSSSTETLRYMVQLYLMLTLFYYKIRAKLATAIIEIVVTTAKDDTKYAALSAPMTLTSLSPLVVVAVASSPSASPPLEQSSMTDPDASKCIPLQSLQTSGAQFTEPGQYSLVSHPVTVHSAASDPSAQGSPHRRSQYCP